MIVFIPVFNTAFTRSAEYFTMFVSSLVSFFFNFLAVLFTLLILASTTAGVVPDDTSLAIDRTEKTEYVARAIARSPGINYREYLVEWANLVEPNRRKNICDI